MLTHPLASVALHLQPGDDIRLELEAFGRSQARLGFVLSAVGNLTQAAFACPGQPAPLVLRGELEILSLSGTVGPEGVHLHLSCSDGACEVRGGHLEPGSLVMRGADLLLGLPQGPISAATPGPSQGAAAPRLAIAVRPGCPYSARALRLLRTLGIEHSLVDPAPGHSVPQIYFDGVLLGGYDALAEMHGRGELEPLRAG